MTDDTFALKPWNTRPSTAPERRVVGDYQFLGERWVYLSCGHAFQGDGEYGSLLRCWKCESSPPIKALGY